MGRPRRITVTHNAQMPAPTRCPWSLADPLLTVYHDIEWGVPVHDDSHHFEHLALETAQAGLSWLTVLRRRSAYRTAFVGFDIDRVAAFGRLELEAALATPGVIRNRRKAEATVRNAAALVGIRREWGSVDAYLWDFVGGAPIGTSRRAPADIPAQTELSARLSRDLRQRGLTFVGPVTCYSHLQSAGLINDHLVSCFRHEPLSSPPGRG